MEFSVDELLAEHYACEYDPPRRPVRDLSPEDVARADELLSRTCSADIAAFDAAEVILLCQAAEATGRAELRDKAEAMVQVFLDLPNWRYPHHQHMDQVELGMATISARLAEACVGLRSLLPDLSRRLSEAIIARGLEPFYEQATDPDRPGWARMFMNWRGYICGDMGRAAFLLRDVYPRWRECVAEAIKGSVAVADVGGEDGGWEEGVGYWGMCFGQIGCLAQELYNASGGSVDLFRHPYFRVAGDFGLYCWMPGRKSVYGFSDWRVEAPRGDLMRYLASHERDPHYQWCADQCPGPGIPTEKTVEARPPDELPPSKHFRGIDVAMLRSGWRDDDVAVGFKCGPRRVQVHQHLDANSFVLYAGESPIVDEVECMEEDCRGLYALLGLSGDDADRDAGWGAAATIGHNTLLLGNAGQLVGETEWGPWIPGVRGKTDAWEHGEQIPREMGAHVVGFGQTEELSFVIGEAAPAYAPPIESFRRAVVLLGSDTVLVADRLTTGAEAAVHALLHVPGEAEQVSADTVKIAQGRRRAHVEVLSAGPGVDAPALQVVPWRSESGEERRVVCIGSTVRAPFGWIVLRFRLGEEAAQVTVTQCEQERLLLGPLWRGRQVSVALGERPGVSLDSPVSADGP